MLRARLHNLLHGRLRAARSYRPLNRITLSRAAVLHNFHLIQRLHSELTVMPVLKANAYGHGLATMAEILNDADCSFIAVDGYFEAAKIRHSTKHRVLVLGYILPANVNLLDTKRCSFVVQDEAGLAAFGRLHRPVRIHMELNTGMNRLGLQPEEVEHYLEVFTRFPNLELEGIMTHLADADNENDESFTREQVARFDAQVERILAKGFKPRFIHIAQTAGSAKVVSEYANAMRLGIGLYGINPLLPSDTHHRMLASLRPVLQLESTIVKVINLKPGDKVGYNGTFIATKPIRIGVLPLGYYEGIPRELGNVGCVTVGTHALPIVGRVCMNHTMIDLRDTNLGVGDEVTVFSVDPKQPNTIARLASDHQLFPYTLLTNLSSSVRRHIV